MVEIINIKKDFSTAERTSHALKGVSLKIEDGDIYGIIGKSGAGKSTLVRCINLLEMPSDGSVLIDGTDMTKLSAKELRTMRRKIATVFQNFNLLMQKTCLQNVAFPLELTGMKKRDAKKRALELLETVGLGYKANAYPAQLSGGQQQRVAIARALAMDPKVLICDEATSALDPTTTNSILELIREINEKTGITVIIITHQMSVVEQICSHVAILDHGNIVEHGLVGDVFSSPKSDAGKALVYPDFASSDFSLTSGRKYVRIIFNSADSQSAMCLSHLASKFGIEAITQYSALRTVNDKTYGSMLVYFNDEESLNCAKEYLDGLDGVLAREVENAN